MQEKRRFKDKLSQQLRFIRRSAELYDRGDKYEAIPIATHLRVLMRDTRHSTSLLSHLKAKDKISLYSSCVPPRLRMPGKRVLDYRGLGRYYLKIEEDLRGASHWIEPVLDHDAHPPVPVSVDEWWNMPIYV